MVNRSLKENWKHHTEDEAGTAIMSKLAEKDLSLGSYNHFKAWYISQYMGDRPLKPSCQDLKTVAADFATHYKAKPNNGTGRPHPSAHHPC